MIQYRASIAVVSVFAEIVSEVERLYKLKTGVGTDTVMFMHGHPNEVNQQLIDLSTVTTGVKRYPFICLLQDFTETGGSDYVECKDLHVLIANITDPTYVASQRYTYNFLPVLYPLYDLLLYAIATNTKVKESEAGRIQHEKTDRLMWGKSGVYGSNGQIFSDRIDAIEITRLQIGLKKSHCLTQI